MSETFYHVICIITFIAWAISTYIQGSVSKNVKEIIKIILDDLYGRTEIDYSKLKKRINKNIIDKFKGSNIYKGSVNSALKTEKPITRPKGQKPEVHASKIIHENKKPVREPDPDIKAPEFEKLNQGYLSEGTEDTKTYIGTSARVRLDKICGILFRCLNIFDEIIDNKNVDDEDLKLIEDLKKECRELIKEL